MLCMVFWVCFLLVRFLWWLVVCVGGVAGVPEWPKGSGLGPDGLVLRGFEPHPPHLLLKVTFNWCEDKIIDYGFI